MKDGRGILLNSNESGNKDEKIDLSCSYSDDESSNYKEEFIKILISK